MRHTIKFKLRLHAFDPSTECEFGKNAEFGYVITGQHSTYLFFDLSRNLVRENSKVRENKTLYYVYNSCMGKKNYSLEETSTTILSLYIRIVYIIRYFCSCSITCTLTTAARQSQLWRSFKLSQLRH